MLEMFSKKPIPLSAIEILEKLKTKGLKVNKTTVYRELEYMLIQKLLIQINFGDGKIRYETSSGEHHHHFVCDNCGLVEEVALDESLLFNALKKTHFAIKRHSLEFFGLCSNCQ